MNILVAGGTGLVGQQLVPALIASGHHVCIVGRRQDKIRAIFPAHVTACDWDGLSQLSPDQFDAIINLAGENIAASRWSESVKQRLLSSRLDATNKLVHWAMSAKTKKPHLYNASAIGIYGLHDHWPSSKPGMSEADLHQPMTECFSSNLVKQWEQAAMAAASHMPVTTMRFGVVLQKNEGMLKKLVLPARLGMGAVIGSGEQPLSWIDSSDLVRAILFLLNHPEITGSVNLTAPQVVTQAEFTRQLAKVLNRPAFLRLPAWFVKMAFGQMGEELLLSGQAVAPARLVSSSFEFTYPTLDSSLRHQLQDR